MKPGIQVPIAVLGGWLTLMALLASRRQRGQKGQDARETTERASNETPQT